MTVLWLLLHRLDMPFFLYSWSGSCWFARTYGVRKSGGSKGMAALDEAFVGTAAIDT